METRKIGESHSASDIAEERNEICPIKNHDDYGRTYGRSLDIKLAQKFVANPMSLVSAISSCFVDKACGHIMTTNLYQKANKIFMYIACFGQFSYIKTYILLKT